MSGVRARWRLKLEGRNPPSWEKFRSERATYEHVGQLCRDRANGTLAFDRASVWISTDGGETWQLYERVNLTAAPPLNPTITTEDQQ